VAVKRIRPNILSERFAESRRFYNDVIGLDGGDGLDWILYPLTDEEWGVRRFLVQDPNGAVINVTEHVEADPG
jgi:hypothetical protein